MRNERYCIYRAFLFSWHLLSIHWSRIRYHHGMGPTGSDRRHIIYSCRASALAYKTSTTIYQEEQVQKRKWKYSKSKYRKL